MHRPLRRYGVGALALALGAGALALTLGKPELNAPPSAVVAANDPPGAAAGSPPATGTPATGTPATGTLAGGAPRVEVLATGLDNPRGLTVTPRGTVLVAEAGLGGQGPCLPSPENPNGKVCLGATGAVAEVWAGGHERILTGLASIAAKGGDNAIGPSDVSLVEGRSLLVSMGLVNETTRRAELGSSGASLGTLRSFDLYRGARRVADLASLKNHESAEAGRRDSNPYGVLALPSGRVAVVDAGSNRLLSVGGPDDVKVLARFPNQQLAQAPGSRQAQNPRFRSAAHSRSYVEPVPTSVTRGPDGALYVGELTGFPFPIGAARVWRLVPGQEPTLYANGFTNIIDLAFDRTGRLHVLQITKNGLQSEDKTGALIRVEPDGKRTQLMPTGLTAPGGMAFGPDGALYVSNHATSAHKGEILRLTF